MFPKVKINLNGIIENASKVNLLCKNRGIKLSVVTKVLCGNLDIVEALVQSGIDCICESRIQNLIKFENVNAEKWLIRIPMFCEVPDVIKYSDVSLNSELDTILALNNEAIRQNKVHKVILMYELRRFKRRSFKR